MKTVLAYLKPHYLRITVAIGFKLVGTLTELLIPLILSHILATVLGSSTGSIVFWGSAMIVCSGVGCVFNIIGNRMATNTSRQFAETMRKDLFLKTLRLSSSATDKFTIPSLESRITTDTYHVHGFINMIQRMGIRAPILLAGGIGITLFMDARLSLVMIAMLPLIFATIYFVRKKGVPLYTKVQKSVDRMIGIVREDSQGIRVIKALSKTEYEHRRFDRANKALVKDEAIASAIMGSVHPLMTVFMNAGSVGVIALGAYYTSAGLSRPETIIAFMQYFTQITMAMMAVTRMFVMYTKCSASANRISEVLNSQDDLEVKDKTDFPDIKTDAHIVFKNVSFSYNRKKDNLKNINFELKKGESLGIIGATGSGKSTLIKLLLRFYDVTQGGIYINGEDVRTIPKARLYAMFGTALQQDFLYAETIEENISFARSIPHSDVEAAAEISQAKDFIENFDDGYNHMLSPHGTNISGGQKQRILIARAIASKPQILVLDDSSSALDYKTDAALRNALSENIKDTTVITVAQRVSSVKNSSLILVMDEGEIIGAGDHEYLMENCKEYSEISRSQMGGAFID